MRIGHGFDVHQLVQGRKLVLGGVEIAHLRGLLGHSDADVLCHAISDAMLGAAALGDIGKHFPDTDPSYKDVSSLLLMHKVIELLWQHGYKISNIDSTLILQKPKVAPFIFEMRRNIANACGIDVDLVSVKATTTEYLGFTGREEGVAAHAIVLLEKGSGDH